MLVNKLQESLVLPVSDWLTGQSVHGKLRFLMQSQYWSRKQLDDYQNERLHRLLEHAFTTVPFYMDYAKEHNLKASDIRTKDDHNAEQ